MLDRDGGSVLIRLVCLAEGDPMVLHHHLHAGRFGSTAPPWRRDGETVTNGLVHVVGSAPSELDGSHLDLEITAGTSECAGGTRR